MDIFFDAEDAEQYGGPPQTDAQTIADELKRYLNEWHALDEVRDHELDGALHQWYAEAMKRPWTPPTKGRPYFSPSSVNSCRRELYVKLRGEKRDKTPTQPHQGRWKRLGTSIGDMIQRDLLFAERHYERLTGRQPRFIFERNDDGTPLFEDFAYRDVLVEHNSQTFGLYGTCDGIMCYNAPDGKTYRVGLEIKSKQTTYSQTTAYSMRNGPKEDHVKQTVAYSVMYGVDVYIILYVNASKKAWNMTPEDAEKYPDIAAFGTTITDGDRTALLDDLAAVLDAVAAEKPPLPDLTKQTFNNYKEATARSLTDAEVDVLRRQVDAMRDKRQKEDAQAALDELISLRGVKERDVV